MKQANPSVFLSAFFLLTIAAVPVVQFVYGETPIFQWITDTVPAGESLKALEKSIERESVIEGFLIPHIREARFSLLKDGGTNVVAGRDGWLFYEPGLSAITQRPTPDQSNASDAILAVTRVRDDLRKKGIRLIVVPVPNKESIYPEKLHHSMAFTGTPIAAEMRGFFAGCEEAGIETVDLFRAFAKAKSESSNPLYLTQDSHWSPEGIRIAAQAVAGKIGAAQESPFISTPVNLRRHGDLIGLMRSPALEARFPAESIRSEKISPDAESADSDVLVIGDSFLRIFQHDEPEDAGFIAHLAKALGHPVTALVNDGGASTLVRQELSRRPGLLAGKTTVIWEFVERDLRLGTEGWQIIPIP